MTRSEKDRRRYAAVEALKLGHGGLSYMASIFGCDRHPLADGLAELQDPQALADPRIRAPGGGRKPAVVAQPDLDAAFLRVLADYTAGSPMNEDQTWTNLRPQQVADRLAAAGHRVSLPVVEGLLQRRGFGKRQARKMRSAGEHADRHAQFERISEHKAAFASGPHPVLSMDTHKRVKRQLVAQRRDMDEGSA
jgi:hypothetical protein